MISDLLKSLESNFLTDPSAPTVANTFASGEKLMSNTSLSCAINCLIMFPVEMSQIEHVVSTLHVQMMFRYWVFQSNEVRGALDSFWDV